MPTNKKTMVHLGYNPSSDWYASPPTVW